MGDARHPRRLTRANTGEIDTLPSEQRRGILGTALRQTGRIRRLAVSLLDTDRIDTEGRPRWRGGPLTGPSPDSADVECGTER
ncbi:hypothetical protein [Planomonospora alba]|uniref:hypothetical protein n=1 Tax=Planomonospora alba TaxID=161354 RepID=UPI0031EDE81A